LLNNTINLIGAIVLVVYVIVATALGSLQWLEKYPTIKKFVEAKALRATLLIVAIVLLFGVFQNINAVREALNVPPPSPKAPPAPIVVVNAEPLRPSVTPQPPPNKAPTQINNAPNGIAIGGGKVTNPTVNNFGSPSRRLTAQQITTIRSTAQVHCSTLQLIPVTAANANQEAQRYALDFVNALKSGGCTADLALPIPGLMPDVVGVYIAVKDVSNLGSMAEDLKQILSEAGIPYLVAPLKPDFFSDKQTVLVIGASE